MAFPEPPDSVNISKNKYILNDTNDVDKWNYGEFINCEHNGINYKYCFMRYKENRTVFSFLRYDLFIPAVIYKNKRKVDNYNSPEAMFIVEYVNSVKLKNKCIRCGYCDNPQSLLFDHINPATKSFDISNYVGIYRSGSAKTRARLYPLILEEIGKCNVMCFNCHAAKTFDNKCGVDKLKTHYDSPEDYLLQNERSTKIYLDLKEGEYEIVQKRGKRKKKQILESPQLMLSL